VKALQSKFIDNLVHHFRSLQTDTLFTTTNHNPPRAAIQLQINTAMDWLHKLKLNAQKSVSVALSVYIF